MFKFWRRKKKAEPVVGDYVRVVKGWFEGMEGFVTEMRPTGYLNNENGLILKTTSEHFPEIWVPIEETEVFPIE